MSSAGTPSQSKASLFSALLTCARLGRILKAYPKDDDALRMLYLRTLARKPTDREREKCLQYVKKVGGRSEAFEDILWALINSTEFQTKR